MPAYVTFLISFGFSCVGWVA